MLSVVIPAYNEEKGIGKVLDELKEILESKSRDYEIIVVDDGSTDHTAKIVKEKEVILIQHPQNKGYGAALKNGIKHAKGEKILITDADGTYPNKEIPRLLEHADQYDMVVGSRTGKDVNIQLYRKPAKWFLSNLANYLSGTNIPDLNSGMRIFSKEDVLKFFNILPSGFSFTTTITLSYLSNDMTIKYVPIDYHERHGISKINPIKDGLNFILLIFKAITYFNPLKVFLPVSFGLFLIAAFLFIYSAFILGKVMDITVIILIVSSIQIALFGMLADLVVRRSEH